MTIYYLRRHYYQMNSKKPTPSRTDNMIREALIHAGAIKPASHKQRQQEKIMGYLRH